VESTPEHELASLRAERESMKFGVFIYDGNLEKFPPLMTG